MRIQHNIMAMNAYRNYNTNTSALSKNLEKLSSGYKINRAGDDAAGLAISEKMRAQITGLNAAQKNVKDGISLVKTAEGAMQEIQDMLNRMDYLATQSANGTYDDPVDRLNLNKEMEALKSEINRIADSANFNGIKLLDGSLDGSAKAAVVGEVSELDIASTGSELGVNTILHKDGAGNNKPTTFKVDLADFQFSGKDGESMTIKVGDKEIKVTADGADLGTKTGGDVASEIAKAFSTTGPTTGWKVEIDGTALTNAQEYIQFNGQDFEVTASNNQLVFTQKAAPTDASENVDGKMKVEIGGDGTAATKGKWVTGAYTAGVLGTDASDSTGTNTDKTNAIADSQIEITAKLADGATAVKFSKTDLSATTSAADLAAALGALAAQKADGSGAYQDADGNNVTLGDLFNISAAADGKITFEAKTDGAQEIEDVTFTAGAVTDNSAADAANGYDTAGTAPTAAALADAGSWTAGAAEGTAGSGGDWNVQTIEVENGYAQTRDRLASTVVTLTEDMFVDGAKFTIADKEITVSTKDADKDKAGVLYVGDMVGDGKTFDLGKVTERLSKAAAGNNAWTVSAKADRTGITLMEKTKADGTSDADSKWDLTTEAGIKETLGYKAPDTAAVAADDTKGLTLQIGDTSDKFNQLLVKVGDMHVSAMGPGTVMVDGKEETVTKTIADINIKTLEDAHEAVNVIKNAINYVSSIRGDLGAVQNRLEHTANNLSVMAENIQDAESTIRDTDVAEEMMKYTKNNILVQSAQAMLAQANAVPQGVLQLLG